MLVMVDSMVPGIGNQYAALAAWDAQLTDQHIAPDRPANLFHPADEDSDHGAHGVSTARQAASPTATSFAASEDRPTFRRGSAA